MIFLPVDVSFFFCGGELLESSSFSDDASTLVFCSMMYQ